MPSARSYRIGEVASQAGVSVETLRYYEKRGLLSAPPRTDGGFRRYSEAVLHQVRFIKQAQSLGLTLDDIHLLLTGQERPKDRPSCRKVRDLLTRRIDDIDTRMQELKRFRRTLNQHLLACEQALASATEPRCPTLQSLEAIDA